MLTLPATSFVPIDTRQLAQPAIVWFDGKLIDEETVRDNAYCQPQPFEGNAMYRDAPREQLAYRYGGIGIGHAGGSGRCASHGQIQIKGVGRTPLVTAQSNWAHTSGMLSLSEAAAEAIWTQILTRVLPYGAVPVYAIILTGGEFRRDFETEHVPRQRALLMRQFALRPAHYMRSLHFKLRPAGDDMCEEAVSRANALATLLSGFELLFDDEICDLTGIDKINTGLKILACRSAHQLASCFAKRIFHGALSPSNIGLDGRMLDFGTMSRVPFYRRQARAANYADQWNQALTIRDMLREFRWHIEKYLVKRGEGLVAEQTLLSDFDKAHRQASDLELIKMAGLPARYIRTLSPAKRTRLFRCMLNIYRRGSAEPYSEEAPKSDTRSECPPAAAPSRFDLNAILAAASTMADEALYQSLSLFIDDVDLRAEFTGVYAECRLHFVQGLPSELHTAARVYIAMQAHRLNGDLSFLMRGDSYGTTSNSLNSTLPRPHNETSPISKQRVS